jgi:transposase
VLAHPRKLRVIAESTRKTDKLGAQVLAEFLALNMIPQAHRPTPRARQHCALVRQRQFVQRRITSAKAEIRHILARYSADVKHLFTEEGQAYLAGLKLLPQDRFVVDQLLVDLTHHGQRRRAADRQLAEFAKSAPIPEQEARAVLASIPCVGTVTADIVLAELGDLRRLRWPRFQGPRSRRPPQRGRLHQGRLGPAPLGSDPDRLADGHQDPPLGTGL